MVLLVDFDDSFTNNILCEFYEFGIDIFKTHWSNLIHRSEDLFSQYDCFVFGPGPGHIDDYSEIYPFVDKLLDSKRKLIGICLGHQLICSRIGYNIIPSHNIKHGLTEQIQLNESWKKLLNTDKSDLIVQRYNSLAVENNMAINDNKNLLVKQNEVMAIEAQNLIGFQFHPESIGTIDRSEIFKFIGDRCLS